MIERGSRCDASVKSPKIRRVMSSRQKRLSSRDDKGLRSKHSCSQIRYCLFYTHRSNFGERYRSACGDDDLFALSRQEFGEHEAEAGISAYRIEDVESESIVSMKVERQHSCARQVHECSELMCPRWIGDASLARHPAHHCTG